MTDITSPAQQRLDHCLRLRDEARQLAEEYHRTIELLEHEAVAYVHAAGAAGQSWSEIFKSLLGFEAQLSRVAMMRVYAAMMQERSASQGGKEPL